MVNITTVIMFCRNNSKYTYNCGKFEQEGIWENVEKFV